MIFRNRHDAARQLVKQLPPVEPENTIVLALPRGGVPIGVILAGELGVPLDVLIVKKIGAPGQRELAVGAVSGVADLQVTTNEDIAKALGLTRDDIRRMAEQMRGELQRRNDAYRGEKAEPDVAGKTVILVDDGIATGATVRSALRLLRLKKAGRIILAIPVAPAETLDELEAEADEIVCLATPDPFYAVGSHYLEFEQVTDNMVIEAIAKASV